MQVVLRIARKAPTRGGVSVISGRGLWQHWIGDSRSARKGLTACVVRMRQPLTARLDASVSAYPLAGRPPDNFKEIQNEGNAPS